MKNIIAVLLILNSGFAYADVCTEAPLKALEYRAQSDFVENSVQAGSFNIPVFQGESAESTFYVDSERSAHQKLDLKLDLSRRALKRLQFSCTNSNPNIRTALGFNRQNPEGLDKFSLTVGQLPMALDDFFKNRDVRFLNSTKIEIVASESSILHAMKEHDLTHYNSLNPWAEDKVHLSILGKKLTEQLQEQFTSEEEAPLTFNIDNQYDLVCDFLTGKASINIQLDTDALSNRLEISEERGEFVLKDHVSKIVEALIEEPVSSDISEATEKSYFYAGAVWEELKDQGVINTLTDKIPAFDVIEGILETGLDKVGSREALCLAENLSVFNEAKSIHKFELDISTNEMWQIEESD